VDLDPVTLRGRHVVLEPLRPEHAHDLWPAANDPVVWRYMPKPVHSEADLTAWIQDRVAGRPTGLPCKAFLQRDARTEQAFGSTSLFDIVAEHRTMEVGHTWIGASHRRTAANTEAKRLILGHAFETLGALRVQFKCDEKNLASAQAIERLGAVLEGRWRNQMVYPDGRRRTTLVFSILDTEWPGVRDRLDGLLLERPA
jgi:N-acetyltransferase